MPLTLSYLRQNPVLDVLPQIDHVLVDEYQDLNRADQVLAVELARNGTITVIGDDNQSIYGFRHANPDGIRTYPDEYPQSKCYFLEQCYPAPPTLLR